MIAAGDVLNGRYRLLEETAFDAHATVFLASDPVLDRTVAAKVLHPAYARSAEARRVFKDEAVRASRLIHPGIVAVLDVGMDTDTTYLVTEYADGQDLAAHLAQHGPLPPTEVAAIGTQIAEALAYAHEQGVSTRTLEPRNVRIRTDGRVQLADFGISFDYADPDRTDSGPVSGSARYLAPEQISGDYESAATDVYQLGLVLHEMCTGEVPFAEGDASPFARVEHDAAPIAAPEIPQRMAGAINRSLARHPEDRPTAAALADILRAVRGEPTPPGGIPAAPAGPTEARARSGRTSAIVVAAIATVVVVAMGIVAVGIVSNGTGPTTTTTAAPMPATVTGVTDYDPEGDETENPEAVGRATDGDPTSVWASERYSNRSFGNAKSGVGLLVELAEAAPVRGITIVGTPGFDAELFVADSVAASRAGWGTPLATFSASETTTPVVLRTEQAGRYVLVWFTRLPPERRIEIAEVDVLT